MKSLSTAALIASFTFAAGAFGLACSSSSSPAGGGNDASAAGDGTQEASAGDSATDAPSNGDSGPASDTGNFVDDTGTTTVDSGEGDATTDTGAPPSDSGTGADAPDTAVPNCGSTPTLHADPAGSLFCGFGVDGGTLVCGAGQECCLGGALGGGMFAPQECSAFGASCTNGGTADAGAPAIPISCSQVADCTANGVAATACCLQGATAPMPDPGCTYPRAKTGTAVVCENGGGASPSACAAGEVNICSSAADCPAGTTCTAGKWKIFQVGFCL